MNFTDPVFVPFIVIVLALFQALNKNWQRIWLIIGASSLFYAWWSATFFLLLAFASCVDYWIGRSLGSVRNASYRRLLLATSIVSNLGMLFFFKYANFFVDNINQLAAQLHLPLSQIAHLSIVLPVGISFFTFETLSYSIDVYCGRFQPTRRLSNFLMFISFFPHLVAGPIVRGKEFLPQLEGDLKATVDQSGTFLVLFGIAKKLLLADVLGSLLVDDVFSHPANYSSGELLFGLYCYAFQIFLDFSAYSDIAIGLAKLFGLDIGVNFNAPYLSRSFSEFWTRWHISLSSWFRDYLYIPLGGNRTSRLRWCFNIMLVFLVSGLWHGANWKFAIWGGLHGFYVVMEYFGCALMLRTGLGQALPRSGMAWNVLKGFFVFNMVCVAWVFFRADTLPDALSYLARIFQFGGGAAHGIPWVAQFILASAVVLHLFVEPIRYALAKKFAQLPVLTQSAFAVLIFCGCYEVSLNLLGQKAFIYFQF